MTSYGVVNKAVVFAIRAHGAQLRKGTDIPYVSHPLSVGLILARNGASEDMVAAGILHDCLEDTAVTFDELRNEFNADIAGLVRGCSEPDRKDTWKNRKTHKIEHLKTAPDEVCVISCADKLHNLLSIINDYKAQGENVWKRFNADKNDQVWYYSSLAEVLKRRQKQYPLFRDYQAAVAVFLAMVK